MLQLQRRRGRRPAPGGPDRRRRASRSPRSRRASATTSPGASQRDLQRRYLAMLDKQETDLEALATRRGDAEKAVQAARDALRTYVSQLG